MNVYKYGQACAFFEEGIGILCLTHSMNSTLFLQKANHKHDFKSPWLHEADDIFFQMKMTALIPNISSQQVNWGRSVEIILTLVSRVKAKSENCGNLWICLMIFNLAGKNIQRNSFNTERKA